MRCKSSEMLPKYGYRENMWHKLETSSKWYFDRAASSQYFRLSFRLQRAKTRCWPKRNADGCLQPSSYREWLTATGRENDGIIATASTQTVSAVLENLMSSWVWHHVDWQMAINISGEIVASVFNGWDCTDSEFGDMSVTTLPRDRAS